MTYFAYYPLPHRSRLPDDLLRRSISEARAFRRGQGFTLIELSIVLVIIGLVAGGVLVGKDLIEAAKIRTLISEYYSFEQAVATFKNKYDELPGDIRIATSIWGQADISECSDVGAGWSPAPAVTTCNGNGDGRIGNTDGNRNYSNYYESQRAWQHLANAGLIAGSYSGRFGGWDYGQLARGLSNPASKAGDYGWTIGYDYIVVDQGSQWATAPGHYFTIRGMAQTTQTLSYNGLDPFQAYSLDVKLDDGMPALGKVKVGRGYDQSNCTKPDSMPADSTDYNLAYSGKACTPLIQAGGF